MPAPSPTYTQAVNIGYSCCLLWDEKESGERMRVHRVDLREVHLLCVCWWIPPHDPNAAPPSHPPIRSARDRGRCAAAARRIAAVKNRGQTDAGAGSRVPQSGADLSLVLAHDIHRLPERMLVAGGFDGEEKKLFIFGILVPYGLFGADS